MGDRHREKRAADKRAAMRLGIRTTTDEFGHERVHLTKAEIRRRRLRDHEGLVLQARRLLFEIEPVVMRMLSDQIAADMDREVMAGVFA